MTFQVDSPGTVLIITLLDILALDILGLDILGLDILGLDILGRFLIDWWHAHAFSHYNSYASSLSTINDCIL